ncbi:MAG: sigma-70 family RNA polymerase sigma factor [Bacteroidetes bacterium]|nr:sigma-70 family RNA polymerase sigma factor [Bacteroidota bacterium]
MKEAYVKLEDWIMQYSDHLYSWASYRLNDPELAKDLVQDTFIAAYQSFDRFEGRSSEKTWLTSILNNKIRDYFRKNKHQIFSLNEQSGERNLDEYFDSTGAWKPEYRPSLLDEDQALLDVPEFRAILYGCLDALSDRFRKVMVGKFLDTKDSTELCQELGISASNFWQILHRAKLQLRNCLDTNWFKTS